MLLSQHHSIAGAEQYESNYVYHMLAAVYVDCGA